MSAREATSGVESSVTVKPSYGLADDQITQMLRDSYEHARDGLDARALREQQVEAERMLEATESALREDADLLSAEEIDVIRAEVAALRRLAQGSDQRAIRVQIDHVNRATEPFATRRMDRAVKRALTGRNVESIGSYTDSMPKITVLPHETLCPQGLEIQAASGKTILNNLLENGIEVEHACEKSCACTTCHVILRQGFDELAPAEEKEEDMLDKAWGLAPTSRLSCQARVTNADLVVEIPKYTINMVSEVKHA